MIKLTHQSTDSSALHQSRLKLLSLSYSLTEHTRQILADTGIVRYSRVRRSANKRDQREQGEAKVECVFPTPCWSLLFRLPQLPPSFIPTQSDIQTRPKPRHRPRRSQASSRPQRLSLPFPQTNITHQSDHLDGSSRKHLYTTYI